jgi:crossover junction endodeoxyribonuclease RuvC
VRVLGIDPGYDRCGWALLLATPGRQGQVLASGTLQTARSLSLPERLHELALGLDTLLAQHAPDCLAVEELYFSKNVKTAIGVAQARGVVLERAAAVGLPIGEYAPTMVKSQLTGNGRADKEQVAFMVRRLVALDNTARLDDELDAIAVALCHSQRASIPAALREVRR